MTRQPFDLAKVALDDRTVVLEASAGTGKTYNLTGLLLRLLLERKIERLDQALVVTFTIAATEELKNRVRAALVRTLRAVTAREEEQDAFFRALAGAPDAARILRQALDDFDQVAIATIHGFCKRLLDESAFESREPFAHEFLADPSLHQHRAAADVLRGHYAEGLSIASALADHAGLTPDSLVRSYQLWQRYPDVSLVGSIGGADGADRVRAALDRAAGAFDDEALARIAALPWGSGKAPVKVASRYSPSRIRERTLEQPLLALADLCQLAPSTFAGRVNKQKRPDLDHPFFAACDDLRAAADDALANLRAALLERMHVRLLADKRKEHVLDFHDLIARTHRALRDESRSGVLLRAIRARYRTALIDEFQDTDRLQYEIFATCFHGRPLFLIGDPKQSIYGFRGADLHAYERATAAAEAQFTLGVNFRSNRQLVEAVQQTCARPGAFVDPAIELPPVQANAAVGDLAIDGEDLAPLQWRFVPHDGQGPRNRFLSGERALPRIAADVTAEISRLLRSDLRCGEEPLAPRHIAVLCRRHHEAALVQEALRGAGVAATIGKTGDVFATDELDELERLMVAVLQPSDLRLCRAAMATRIYGMDAANLAALEGDDARLDAEAARLEGWRRNWTRDGFCAMKEEVFAALGVAARLLANPGGERRLTNLRQLTELLHQAEHDGHLSPRGLLDWLRGQRNARAGEDPQQRMLRLESDADAVQLMTVHASKGLQFEVVFSPFLGLGKETRGQGIVADGDRRELIFALQKSSPEKARAEIDRLAEDARLCYVALTRAKRRCYVHLGQINNWWLSALAWMLDPTPEDGRTGPWLDDWRQRMKKDPDRLSQLVSDLVAGSGGRMERYEVPTDPRPEPVPPPTPIALDAPRRASHVPQARSLASFSSLTADAPGEPVGREAKDPARVQAVSAPAAGIFAFARGPNAGSCLHAVLEHHAWTGNDEALEPLVRGALRSSGLIDPARHAADLDPTATVIANVRDLERALVQPGGPSYRALCGGRRKAEWQFTMTTGGGQLAELATLFAASSSPVARHHAPRLAGLQPRALRGYLTGFVDLIAEHEGRYWIIDWKSNHLGNTTACYSPEAIAEAMHEHDYVLQYHLYVLALHRQLAQRYAGYDYDLHFGGVGYAFLRGAVPGTTNGMYFDRPPRELVAGMDAWLRGTAGGGQP